MSEVEFASFAANAGETSPAIASTPNQTGTSARFARVVRRVGNLDTGENIELAERFAERTREGRAGETPYGLPDANRGAEAVTLCRPIDDRQVLVSLAEKMNLGLLGGADRPPQPTAQASDFPAVHRRMSDLCNCYRSLRRPDIVLHIERVLNRVTTRVTRQYNKFTKTTEQLEKRPDGVAASDYAYHLLQKMASQAETNRDLKKAEAIHEVLDLIDQRTAEEWQALRRDYGTAEAPSHQAGQRPPARPPSQFEWINSYWQLRDLSDLFAKVGWVNVQHDFHAAVHRTRVAVMRKFQKCGGIGADLLPSSSGVTMHEQAYHALEEMAKQAANSGDFDQADKIHRELESLYKAMTKTQSDLTRDHGAFDALSDRATQAMQALLPPPIPQPPARIGPTTSAALPVTAMPPVTVPSMTVPPAVLLDVPGQAHPIVRAVNPALLDPSATTHGTMAAQPAAIETIGTAAFGESSSFWLQPFDPVPAPGTVPFESRVHHAAGAVQPPPLATAPGAVHQIPSHSPAWLDDFAVERALIADQLPPGFDASQLIIEAGAFVEFGIANNLEAGLLPTGTIEALIEGYEASDVGDSNLLNIEYLHMLKQNIERALRDAYPGRTHPQWLDQVREYLHRREEIAEASAASATGLPELGATEIDELLGTDQGVSHSALPSPASATGLPELGTTEIDELLGAEQGVLHSAPPAPASATSLPELGVTEIDQLLGTDQGVSHTAPPPAAFDPWSEPPGPSSRVMPIQTIRAPVTSTGAPPGRRRAEAPSFGRADSGALPLSQREAIVHRFRTEVAVFDAEYSLQTGGASALEWSANQVRAVLADLFLLSNIARFDPDAAAAMENIDWNAMYALMQILDVPPLSP